MFSKFAVLLFLCFFCSTSAQLCSDYVFSNNNLYATCNTLPVLNSTLHWTYYPSNHSVDLAFRRYGLTASNWIAWALNLGSGKMLGSQCLIAFQNSTTGQVHAYTSPISSYGTRLQEGPLSFDVPRIAAELKNNEMIIYASIQLPTNRTSFTHVWQFGDVVQNALQPHRMAGDNMKSFGTIDFATGRVVDTGVAGGGSSRNYHKNVHGVLNVVSWGILLPLGAIVARYLKVFINAPNPAWFYLHVTCQCSGYIVGLAGWITGLVLGSTSRGAQHHAHRNIGITIFALATLQVLGVPLKPKPQHKPSKYYSRLYTEVTIFPF